jgi:hypothetical protein
VIDGAYVNDHKLLEQTIDAIVVPRSDPAKITQHLCLDKAYDNPTSGAACAASGYVPHIRRIGEEKQDGSPPPARTDHGFDPSCWVIPAKYPNPSKGPGKWAFWRGSDYVPLPRDTANGIRTRVSTPMTQAQLGNSSGAGNLTYQERPIALKESGFCLSNL